MKTYAFIFARKGSKGLPGKNKKLLCGKPLICYSIETAKQCQFIDDIFVSTDDEDIIEIATEQGVNVIKRDEHLTGDKSPEWLSWQHAVDYVEKRHGTFDRFISLPTTSPLRSEVDVKAAYQKLNDTGADVCITVTPSHRSPYFNMVSFASEDSVRLTNAGESYSRRQDVPDVYDITTVAYVSSPAFIKKANKLFDGRVTAVVTPKERSVDIDDNIDFILATALLENTHD